MEQETFYEGLQRISERVEKMPAWKKEGWAILDDPNYYCGTQDTRRLNMAYNEIENGTITTSKLAVGGTRAANIRSTGRAEGSFEELHGKLRKLDDTLTALRDKLSFVSNSAISGIAGQLKEEQGSESSSELTKRVMGLTSYVEELTEKVEDMMDKVEL